MEVEKLEGDVLLVADSVAEDLEIGALLYYGASEGEARYPCPARGGYFRLRKLLVELGWGLTLRPAKV